MSDARAAILDRVERALRSARIPHEPAATPPAVTIREPQECLDRFLRETQALGVEVFVESSAIAVRERLRTLTADRRILSWNPERLPYGAGEVVTRACLGSAPLHEQADADIGVTGCDGAIAETGSLALLSAQGASRTVSLLPPVHVALVQPKDLFFSMGEFFTARAAQLAERSSCTFVTGPSRTADIELSLTIGVHGPGRLLIIFGPP